MANLLKIKEIIKEKKISLRDVAKQVGITEQGLQKLVRENSTKVETLEAISRVLDVPITRFFEECVSEKNNMPKPIQRDPLIESQQRTIENLTDIIKNLTDK